MAHTALAIFDLFSGRHDEARRRLHRALDLDPNSMFARGYLGMSYAFGGGYRLHCRSGGGDAPQPARSAGGALVPGKGWAALLAGRDEEADEFAVRAAEANPGFPDICAVLAAAAGQLGRAAAARAALDQLLQRIPSLTTSDSRLDRPFARAFDRERFLEGLCKAGMPA